MEIMSDPHEFLKKMEERREQQRNLVEFRWCDMIREAGNIYQETNSISKVKSDLGLSENRTKEALKLYQLIYSCPLDVASTEGYRAGIQFFVEDVTIEELVEERDWSIEVAKDYVCEFVGALYQRNDVKKVKLENPPEKFTGGPSEATIEAIQSISADLQPIRESAQQAAETLQGTLPDFRDIFAPVREHYQEVQQALENGIQNFDDPENYDASNVKIDTRAQQVGVESVASLLKDLKESDENELDSYITRISRGLAAYLNEEYILPCFIFISVQDGLMSTLCSEQGKTPNGDGYYTASQKRKALKESYEKIDHDYYGVSAAQIESNLEDFWNHRNAIMHGSLIAHFDKNIATISLLFLMFSLYTTIEVVGR